VTDWSTWRVGTICRVALWDRPKTDLATPTGPIFSAPLGKGPVGESIKCGAAWDCRTRYDLSHRVLQSHMPCPCILYFSHAAVVCGFVALLGLIG